MFKDSNSIKTGFFFLLIVAIGIFVIAYTKINSLVDAAAIVNHTNIVKLELNNIFSNLKDMESSTRGYLITKDPSFLSHYNKNKNLVVFNLNKVVSVTSDNALQQKNFAGLDTLIKKRIDCMEIFNSGIIKKENIAGGVIAGRNIMEEIRIKIDKMISEENRLLVLRSSNLENRIVQIPILAVSFAVLLGLVLITLYLKTMKNLQLDVTKKTKELADSIESLKLKNIELIKLNKELESISYISSHDLQEPLRKIQIFASNINIDEHKNLSEGVQYSLKKVRESAKRMQTLIQDFMAYSRNSAEGFTFENINLREILDIVEMDLREELSRQNVIIEASELCQAHIIPSQFRELLNNLIGNSLKYSNPRTPLHIIITGIILKGSQLENDTLFQDKNYCLFTLSDNGIGFDPKYNERIFGIFSRLHDQSQYKGTGIGLSLVKKVVENHFGLVTANGVPGKGTTIKIIIPSPSFVENPGIKSLV